MERTMISIQMGTCTEVHLVSQRGCIKSNVDERLAGTIPNIRSQKCQREITSATSGNATPLCQNF